MQYVSILCLHEYEHEGAQTALAQHGTVVTEGNYVSGYLDEAEIEALLAEGMIVTAAAVEDTISALQDEAIPQIFDDGLLDDSGEDGGSDGDQVPGPERFVVEFVKPVGKLELDLIAQTGAEMESRISFNRYVVVATLKQAHVLQATSDLVGSVTVYGVKATLSAEQVARVENSMLVESSAGGAFEGANFGVLADNFVVESAGDDDDAAMSAGAAAGAAAATPPQNNPVHIRCHPGFDVAAIAAEVANLPGVSEVDHFLLRITCMVEEGATGSSSLNRIGSINGTAFSEDYVEPEPLLEFAVPALFWAQPTAVTKPFPFQGEGQLLAIADTGLDAEHPDFAGRNKVVQALVPPSPRDEHGHGTHVASIAAGDGKASGGKLVGVAPKAKILMEALAGPNGQLEGLKQGLTKLLQDAFDKGARVLNLSWGSPVESNYVLNSLELDEFVRDHPDFLVIVAAGNSGMQDNNFADGSYTAKTLCAPATAKNCLTVGASCSPRKDGPFKDLLWSDYPGSQPPTFNPMAEKPLTGDSAVLASISSRGPAQGMQIKPDLVAPGVGIAAARSGDFSSSSNGSYAPFPNEYVYLSGTSMAAPMVSGAAILLREYLATRGLAKPSAALMKAALINGTVWSADASGEEPEVGEPNCQQGFGRLVLERVFPVDAAAGFELRLADVTNGSVEAVIRGDREWVQRFTVTTATEPLTLTLTWTDLPGSGPGHMLNLLLISPAEKQRIPGNPGLKRLRKFFFDETNNVQQIRVLNPEPGEWKVRISGSNTAMDKNGAGQGFGLALTGAVSDWL